MNGMAEVEGGIWTMTDTEFKRELAEAKAEALEEAAEELAKESPFHSYDDTEAHWRIGRKWAHILRARAAEMRAAA